MEELELCPNSDKAGEQRKNGVVLVVKYVVSVGNEFASQSSLDRLKRPWQRRYGGYW